MTMHGRRGTWACITTPRLSYTRTVAGAPTWAQAATGNLPAVHVTAVHLRSHGRLSANVDVLVENFRPGVMEVGAQQATACIKY